MPTPSLTLPTLTDAEAAAPWDDANVRRRRTSYRVVLAWSFDEPTRVGESATLTSEAVLGRGSAQSEDPAPRLIFHRRRPTAAKPGQPLVAARVSRLQLVLKPAAEGLHVRSVGKCKMSKNGTEMDEAIFRPGDVLTLKNALVLYIASSDEMPTMRTPVSEDFAFAGADTHGIVGESPESWTFRDELAFAAASPHHVLVLGESGSGKELAARAIHELSARGAKPLVARNAATVPSSLVDAELFGTAKNYPNAGSPERPGLLGEADGSTLFLDEIGELPPEIQAHLLRVLDRGGEYQRLGESVGRRSDVRVIAATNRDPSSLKHDFLARFTARVAMPPLDARREDIPLLVQHLLALLVAKMPELTDRFFEGADKRARLEPALIEALLRHEYTHHVRELDRLLWLALSTSRENFLALTDAVEKELRLPTEEQRTEEPDRAAIEAALAASGSVTKAAERLGLANRFALYRLMKKHGLGGE